LYGWIQAAKKGDLDIAGKRHDAGGGGPAASQRGQKAQQREQTASGGTGFSERSSIIFCSEPSEVSKKERMKFIAMKTDDGREKGSISFYCRVPKVTRQGFHEYLINRDKPWKHENLAAMMMDIITEDEWNDTYGRERMHMALELKYPEANIPSERTVYRVMKEIGLTHKPNRKPNGITKANRDARKSDDLIHRDFRSEKPCENCVTDITEIKAKDGKLYVSAIFDCFDVSVLGLAMDDNMRAEPCVLINYRFFDF